MVPGNTDRIFATFFNIKHELFIGSPECGRLISVRVKDRDRVPVAFSAEKVGTSACT